MKYDELGYSLPDSTAQEAAQKAIAILEAVAKVDAACLFYCVQASNILAFAGLRAQSPYNEFRPGFSQEKRALLRKVLREHGHAILYDKTPYFTDDRDIFFFSNVQAFNDLPERYKIVKSFWKQPLDLADIADFSLWSDHVHLALVKLMENDKLQLKEDKLPKEWLLDWWSPHNIRFGMLLGYPGPAISSFCWDEARRALHKRTGKELEPSFPFQGVYCGTVIDYGYSNKLRKNRVLQAHEKLWSDTLTLVYQAFSEDRLLGLPEFKSEYHRYKKYDEGY